MRGGSGSVERPRVEVSEDAADKFDGMAVGQLLVFIAGTLPAPRIRGNAIAGPQPRRRPSLRSGLRRGYSHRIPPLFRLQSGFVPAPTAICLVPGFISVE